MFGLTRFQEIHHGRELIVQQVGLGLEELATVSSGQETKVQDRKLAITLKVHPSGLLRVGRSYISRILQLHLTVTRWGPCVQGHKSVWDTSDLGHHRNLGYTVFGATRQIAAVSGIGGI